ncbi:MAG TPA: GNAT family N-acetyltransferase [Patescibacteria group bacterium]|jgi:ribosomal protein S18 acetylase RimI-like enzyme|nr:GNAT family N-acetyltransferase [Patescibacteria group bacterium]
MVNIRQARTDEVEKLQFLDDEVFLHDVEFDPDLDMTWAKGEKGRTYFSKLINDPNSYCLIAEDNNKAIGYLVASSKNVSYRKSKCAELQNMGVSPTYRSKGIGSMLVQKCFEWAKLKGYQKMYVSAYFGNIDAIKFYKKNGFVEIDLGLEVDL